MSATPLKKYRYWAIVPAAGMGLRMGSTVPKQYLPLLDDKTIIEHAVETLCRYPRIEKVVVVLNEDDHHWSEIQPAFSDKIITTIGGELRAQSVLAGLETLRSLAASDDWILVHDAVRPCLQHKNIDRLIRYVGNHDVGGILGIPVRDTLKQVEDNVIIETIDREQLWSAQTPQMFRYELLTTALKNALSSQKKITDEASAVEYLQKKPIMVQGDPRNIKITYPEDLAIAETYVKEMNE